jgi:hypothetical protein
MIFYIFEKLGRMHENKIFFVIFLFCFILMRKIFFEIFKF